jgi:hypothetical protein
MKCGSQNMDKRCQLLAVELFVFLIMWASFIFLFRGMSNSEAIILFK